MTENGLSQTIKVTEITFDFFQTIKIPLGMELNINPKGKKIFMGENAKEPFVIFTSSNVNPKTINLNIFPGLKATEADLRESVGIIQRILPDIYSQAEEIIVQIKDNDGIIKQALCDFSIMGRFIILKKTLRREPRNTSLKKIADEVQKQLDAQKNSEPPPKKIAGKNLPSETPDKKPTEAKKEIAQNKPEQTASKPIDTNKTEKKEPTISTLANPVEIITAKTPEPEPETLPKHREEKKNEKPEAVQKKIEAAYEKHNLTVPQKSILEALAEKTLSKNEIRDATYIIDNLKGHLQFLKGLKLINFIGGKYKLNLQD